MREIKTDLITDVIEKLCIDANCHLPGDVKCAIKNCRACEDGEIAKGILDDIIEMYVEKNCPIDDIYLKYDKSVVDETIRKISRTQFKRKQCCLGLRLTERSFLNGVSYPIVRGFN